ncbi:MAG TPA: nucleoside diphosphate kinase regulator [Desulfitobacteriaceae bacterium]|nr:nucleoside diphosphate kinase regulator [Desulfitobacteriaceae bacterium]
MTRSIIITSIDHERLLKLVNQEREFGMNKNRKYLRDLEQELNRASIVPSEQIPPGIITMNSRILLRDLDTGEEMTYVLVYPEDASLIEDKISVLAPIGTAILGFREGDIIDWEIPNGKIKLKVEKILYQPEAAGNFEL